jgi:NDP-sugar pyrophosphorylase family protein
VLRTVRDRGIRLVPILDAGGRIVDLLDAAVLAERAVAAYPPRDRPVVIMAGGEGTRLRPLTKVLPKPLVPFGERTLVEVVMDGFARYGFDRFILTLNYLADAVESYFDSHTHPWAIETVREPEFLGTAGALSLVTDQLSRGCVVSNCDVLVEADFDAMMSFHARGGYAATLLGVAHRMEIPYGVLEVDGERLTGITEKPSYAMLVNSGVYVLEPEVLALIEPGVRLDMPTLLDRARLQGLPIGVLPIERGWFDVGRWDQYRAALRHVLAKED